MYLSLIYASSNQGTTDTFNTMVVLYHCHVIVADSSAIALMWIILCVLTETFCFLYINKYE
jgi:hypothetical protein